MIEAEVLRHDDGGHDTVRQLDASFSTRSKGTSASDPNRACLLSLAFVVAGEDRPQRKRASCLGVARAACPSSHSSASARWGLAQSWRYLMSGIGVGSTPRQGPQ